MQAPFFFFTRRHNPFRGGPLRPPGYALDLMPGPAPDYFIPPLRDDAPSGRAIQSAAHRLGPNATEADSIDQAGRLKARRPPNSVLVSQNVWRREGSTYLERITNVHIGIERETASTTSTADRSPGHQSPRRFTADAYEISAR